MSCFIVSDNHIKQIAMIAAGRLRGSIDMDLANDYALELWSMNHAAYCERYSRRDMKMPELSDAPKVTPCDVIASRPESVFMIKQIQCYEYQACDSSGWESSVAQSICKDAHSAAIENLPGYDAAPWGME